VLLLGDVQFQGSAEGHAVVRDAARLTGIADALGIGDAELNRVLTTKTFSARFDIFSLRLSIWL
jgi:myosin heavy subunit